MAELYRQGYSLAEVANLLGITRQSVFKILKLRGVQLRKLPSKPFVIWKSKKYTLRSNGYFALTTGERTYLHRDMWEDAFGAIPAGHDVHHKDEDKLNNRIENFALHTQSEHGRRHGFGGNQHTGSLGGRPVKW